MHEKGTTMKLKKGKLLPSPFNWRSLLMTSGETAHGFAHIDRYYLDGRKVKKELNLKLDEALTLADEDVRENWNAYQKAFLEVR